MTGVALATHALRGSRGALRLRLKHAMRAPARELAESEPPPRAPKQTFTR